MNYLYHKVPKSMQGNILFPLNMLKNKYPDIYEQEIKKYSEREPIMQQKVPILNCLWNDALHLIAVHPKEIKKALINTGRNPNFPKRYYQVDPNILEPRNTIVYLYAHTDNRDKLKKKNFLFLSSMNYLGQKN